MPIIPFEGRVPRVHPTAFIAPTAMIIGDVTIGEHASIWYGCVLRGDIEPVVVGARSNVQDNSVLHTARGEACIVKEDVTVGHMVCLHACTVEPFSLIGIMSTVLNRAVVGAESIVGAGAVVTEGHIIAPRSLVVGVPAKVLRSVSDEDVAWARANVDRYVRNGARHQAALDEWERGAK